MEKFLVPQYIDTENKIIGNVTTRQFVEMLIWAGVSFIVWRLIWNFWLRIGIIVFLLAIFGMVAFGRVNGMPFHYFILNVAQTFKKPRLRVWLRRDTKPSFKLEEEKVKKVKISKQQLAGSHLSDLSLIVNTGGAYRGEDIINENNI